MLEESQVDSRGVVVIEVAENTLVNELTNFSYCSSEEEGVVYHYPELLPLGQLDQLFRLPGGRGEWLLDEDVLAVLETGLGQFEVRADRGHDGDGVDLWGTQQLGGLRRDG